MKLTTTLINLFCVLILLLQSCNSNIDFKSAQQVSLTIKESKEKKVFIAQYKIENITTYDSAIKFPFDSIWVEKHWNLALDSSGKETFKVDDSSVNLIVFSVVKGTFLNNKNLTDGEWIINDEKENFGGSIRGMICMDLINYKRTPDSMKFSIYLTSKPHDYKNNLHLVAKFTIERSNNN